MTHRKPNISQITHARLVQVNAHNAANLQPIAKVAQLDIGSMAIVVIHAMKSVWNVINMMEMFVQNAILVCI